MNEEEMEEVISKLLQKVNKNDINFKLDKKIIDVFKKLNFFDQIIKKYPDFGNFIITEVLLNLSIKKYNQFQIIWDDNKNILKGIIIILLGFVNIYIYNYEHKSKSNEIKINISTNKTSSNKDFNSLTLKKDIQGIKSKNSTIDEIEPIKINNILTKGDSIGQTFIKNIFKNEIISPNDKNIKDEENNLEKKEKYDSYYKIESKTKSIIGFLAEEDYNMIIEKVLAKERHDRYTFFHKINYMPKDKSFIDRFQNNITKKYFPKNSTIFMQNEVFKTFYIIASGLVRLSVSFNRQFFCSLDFDVLIGQQIKDRFTSNRFFEITGNYREEEKFIIVDLGIGEILGGIEYCKNIKNYIFSAQCNTDVILYEVNLNFFNNILAYWPFQRFYDKINKQFDYLKNRIMSINNFKVEKGNKDDYSFSQNKFIQTYKRGHPLSPKKDIYLKKFINPFNFEKKFKSKAFKIINTRYNKEKLKNKNIVKNRNNNKMPFITNIPKKIKLRKLKKSKTMMFIKINNKKLEEGKFEFLYESKKDNNESNKNNDNLIEPIKIIKKKSVLRHSNTSLNIDNNKYIRKNGKKRLNSVRIENGAKEMIKYNLYEKIINDREKILNSNNKYNKNKNNIKFRNNTQKKNIIKNLRKNDSFKEKLIYDTNNNKNSYNKLKHSSVGTQSLLAYNKKYFSYNDENENYIQPKINQKNLIFPYGIQEIYAGRVINKNELLSNFINNNYIKKILKLKKGFKINEFFLLRNNTKLKNKKAKSC